MNRYCLQEVLTKHLAWHFEFFMCCSSVLPFYSVCGDICEWSSKNDFWRRCRFWIKNEFTFRLSQRKYRTICCRTFCEPRTWFFIIVTSMIFWKLRGQGDYAIWKVEKWDTFNGTVSRNVHGCWLSAASFSWFVPSCRLHIFWQKKWGFNLPESLRERYEWGPWLAWAHRDECGWKASIMFKNFNWMRIFIIFSFDRSDIWYYRR